MKDLRGILQCLTLENSPVHYRLNEKEKECMNRCIDEKCSTSFDQSSFEETVSFVKDSQSRSQLPAHLIRNVENFCRGGNGLGLFLIQNLPVDSKIGATGALHDKETSISEVILFMMATLTGDLYGYADQRGGSIVQDLYPIKRDMERQIGTGSTFLEWHTEDAYHPYRCDYVLLNCLRGDPSAFTLVSQVNIFDLDQRMLSALMKKNFTIRPDDAHDNLATRTEGNVLNFVNGQLYVRYDPLFTKCRDTESEEALRYLGGYLAEKSVGISLREGEMVIVDNRTSVHARTLFQPRFDGNDRWIQRVVTLERNVPDEVKKADKPYLITI